MDNSDLMALQRDNKLTVTHLNQKI